jgi:hypothetical protein
MLNAHPRIYLTHETSFYLANRLCPGRATGAEFLEYYFRTTWFRWLRLDPRLVIARLSGTLSRWEVGTAFTAIMQAKAAQYGRPRFGDKTPGHASCLSEIFADFPDARVIHIVRDPRATVQSLQMMPWASPSALVNALYLADERRQVAGFRDRLLEIRLEDLLAHPRSTMGRVLEHVGEDWDDAVLDHSRNLVDRDDMPPVPWHESATQERFAGAISRATLPATDIRVVEWIARQAMKEGGYARATAENEPHRVAVAWSMARQIPAFLRSILFGMRCAFMVRRDPQCFDDALTLPFLRSLNPGAWTNYPGFEMPIAPPPPLLNSRW